MKRKRAKWSQEDLNLGTSIIRSGVGGNPRVRLLIATPTLGNIRIEWAVMRYGQVIPPNWASHDVNVGIGTCVPMHYLVADAQNIATEHMLQNSFEWLLLWEDDVIAPQDLLTRLDRYITDATIPIVSGLYFLKAKRSEPLAYKGRGTRCFCDFRLGDKVWLDGVPTGMLLVHRSILDLMYQESPPYKTVGGRVVRKVFETPMKVMMNPQTGEWNRMQGTSDLFWCQRIVREKVLERAGWPKIAKKEFPFLLDTNILCSHIDLNTGEQFPSKEVLDYFRRPRAKKG
jgi:hypothetical protein